MVNSREPIQKQVIIVVVLALCVIFSVAAQAAMRCVNLMVQEGANGIEIQADCGQPAARERYFIDKYGEVDKWVCGPDAGYLYVIYLYVGKVVEIEEIQQ